MRRALQGQFPAPGARAALREIELSDYEKLFQKRRIFTGIRGLEGEQSPAKERVSLYQGLLANAWQSLPEPVRALHAASHPSEFAGVCTVDRGTSVLSRLVARIIGLPKAGMNQAIQVRFDKQLLKDGRSAEVWRRTINGQSFSSLQFVGRGRTEALINERFGPSTYAMAVIVRDQQLHLVLRAWSVLGIPLPLWLGPRAKAFESADADRFRFFVEIAHPLVGLIVRYQGTLVQTS